MSIFNKTNAMRLLDEAEIKYTDLHYDYSEDDLSGKYIAKQINIPQEQVFKTLVARGDKSGLLVFCLPIEFDLDLKKVAYATHNKKIELVHVKELLNLTGYIRGGCSPIGMKKRFPTYIEESAQLFDNITISAGVRGCQLLINPNELFKFTNAEYFEV